jgi:hypothetical protein
VIFPAKITKPVAHTPLWKEPWTASLCLIFEAAAVKHSELSGSFCGVFAEATGRSIRRGRNPSNRIHIDPRGSGPMGIDVGGRGAQPARIQVLGHSREQCRIWEEEIPTFAARVSLSLPIHARRGRE